MVKNSIFLCIFFCFIIIICRAQENDEIHWEVILPDNFSTILIDLNKNKEVIKKAKVSEMSYKSLSEFIPDSSKIIFDSSGCIISRVFGVDVKPLSRCYVKFNKIYKREIYYANCIYGYDKLKRINKIDWYYINQDSTNIKKKIYSYSISYSNDKDNFIDKINITDSLDILLGRVTFKYKNQMLTKEVGFWREKKYYEKKHYYYYDKSKINLVKEDISINNTIIDEIIYQDKSKIYLKSYDDGIITESISFCLDNVHQYEFSSFNINKYGSSEVIYQNWVYEYNNEGNLVAVFKINYNNKKIPTLTRSVEIIYNTKGLIEKKIEYFGEDEAECKYFYKYSF